MYIHNASKTVQSGSLTVKMMESFRFDRLPILMLISNILIDNIQKRIYMLIVLFVISNVHTCQMFKVIYDPVFII